MPRLQKIAFYCISVAVATVALVVLLHNLFGEPCGLMGIMLLVAVVPMWWLFKAENGVKLDEMEQTISLRSYRIGTTVFWLIAMLSMVLIPAFLGYSAMMPAWYLGLFPYAGGYVALVTLSLSLLWCAGQGEGGILKLAGLVVLGIVLVAPAFAGGVMLLHGQSELGGSLYAGSFEADEWHVTAPDSAEVHSRITLSRWPRAFEAPKTPSRPPMRISLPYDYAKVTSVRFENKEVQFHHIAGAAYDVMLPSFEVPFDLNVDVIWTVPLKPLWGTVNSQWGPRYWVELQSLIPTNSLSSKTLVDPKSGFRCTLDQYGYGFSELNGEGTYCTARGQRSLGLAPATPAGGAAQRGG